MEATTKIIVVDDEKRICQNVQKILKKNNFEVTQATSAQDAIDKMAKDSYALLISDIVMPGKNGLELLKLVKEQWPLTKAVMMTAYASTDTAMKAIRLGALDYLPKPFTPSELRSTVEKALKGELVEVEPTPQERESIDVIDIDMPFDADEVAEQTGEDYAKMLGRSDMPVVEVKISEPAEGFCETGAMVCDIFKKLGATCKAGTKTGECPQKKAKKPKKAAAADGVDRKKLIGIDMPFDYQEVLSVTGPEYLRQQGREDAAYVPYEELKQRVAQMDKRRQIDVDVPFDRDEVAAAVGEQYADTLNRSDTPTVEVKISEPVEGFCEIGNMACDIFKKLGATCKAGTKSGECPQLKAKKKKPAARPVFDANRMIAIDQPFDKEEVAAVAGPDYIAHLHHEDTVAMPYAELKQHVARLDAELAAQADAERRAQTADSMPKRVLVVDDEVGVNNNIRKILGKRGYEVDQAFGKDEALKMIAETSYPLVLLDLKMPGVKDLELLSTIRDRQPDAKVIIITGYASIETAVEAARMGAVEYLPKPFTPKEVRAAADYALKLAA